MTEMSDTVSTASMLIGEQLPLLSEDDDDLLHRLFERNLSCTKDGDNSTETGIRYVSVNGNAESMTYGILNKMSNATARQLMQHCRDSNLRHGNSSSAIVLDIEPSLRLMIGVMATLKLGLAYVPVDSSSTAIDRIKYILQVTLLCLLIYHVACFIWV